MRLTVTLSGVWVLGHRGDDVLPIEHLKNAVGKKLGDTLSVESEGLTLITFRINDENANPEEIKNKVHDIFFDIYPSDANEDVITLTTAKVRASDAEAEESGEEEAEDLVKASLDAIDTLVGADEFKKLAHEIAEIAPLIISNNTRDILTHQSYLFSINDGCGLTTYLSALSSLIKSLNLPNISNVDTAFEENVPLPKNDNDDPFGGVTSILNFNRPDSIRIVCVDISEWMNKTNDRVFKNFLVKASKRSSHNIFIFRVPFVDKEVLDRIKLSLNDLLYVRTISFPPFDNDELQICANKEIEKYGFTMSESAWRGFHDRIAEEKRDGKFYGINTVRKVVKELLYKKQLNNARKGSNDKCICDEDTLSLCGSLYSNTLTGYEMLDRMIGGEELKQKINEIVSQIQLARSKSNLGMPCIHMKFVGNPGTGKTTVARIVGKILKEKGILRVGNFFEYSGRDFCGRYIGETAPKTSSMCRDAYGSVLFIDEAYSLYRGDGNERDYGREALDTLIAEMENHRSDLVVIMAGYTDEMDILMKGNTGLASRVPYTIEFPNFTRAQLYDIFVSMLSDQFKYEDDLLPSVKKYFDELPDEILESKEFSNARFVRNLFERTWAKASMRCQLAKIDDVSLVKDDFERSTSDKEFSLIMQKKTKIGFIN